jgi:transcriptional regulator with XRE-family HTH domain
MILNIRLKELRQYKCLSQKQLVSELEISERHYQRYEAGKAEPTASILVAIANFHGVSIDYLVGRTDNPEVNQ